jgi:hypothetical protein
MMLHRRLLVDDHRGVREPLNETDTIITTGYIVVDQPQYSSRQQRALALYLNNPNVLVFAGTPSAASVSMINLLLIVNFCLVV